MNEAVLEVTAKATLNKKDTDKDGLLTPKEFVWDDPAEGEDLPEISEDDQEEFLELDKDGSGKLDIEELKAWESGRFHTEESIKKLFEIADTDRDMHITAEELDT